MTTLDKTLYTAHARSTGGRDGRVTTSDGTFDLPVVMPKALGGPGVGGTNPEQLFAAGYAACFGSAVAHIARLKKLRTGPVVINANVSIGPVGGGARFGLAVELVAELPELPRDEAEALLAAAHEVCPYSNATRGNIAVAIKLS